VWLNYRRQSTEGWNMHNVLLDFGGGALSLVQLVMDGAVTRDWSAVTGNPVKFGLGSASMLFDVVFMAQHWLLYPAASRQPPSFWEALEAVDSEEQASKDAAKLEPTVDLEAAAAAGTPASPAALQPAPPDSLADSQPLLRASDP
jgi:cystinosin